MLADGAERARAIAAATLADVRAAMGVGPPPRRRLAAIAFARALAELELDLDVFSGPFDLLLTLVLREEVDLRELALAEVVVAYLDHLDARGELDLEATTEFIVLRRRAAGAEVAAAAARRGGRRAARPRARARPPRSCSRGCSTRAATAPPPRTSRERLAAQPAVRYREAPLPAHLRRSSLEDVDGPIWEPRVARRARSPACSCCRRKLDLRHISVMRVIGRRARRAPARAAALARPR